MKVRFKQLKQRPDPVLAEYVRAKLAEIEGLVKIDSAHIALRRNPNHPPFQRTEPGTARKSTARLTPESARDSGSNVDLAPRWKNILVPVEMSTLGEQTLARGLALACWFKANLTAFNVLRTGRLRSQHRSARARTSHYVEAKTKFSAWVSRRIPSGVAVESCVGVGKTAPTFLQAARHLKVHLIVMGTQQFSGWRRFRAACAIGRILGETPCPILSIPQLPGGVRTRTAAWE